MEAAACTLLFEHDSDASYQAYLHAQLVVCIILLVHQDCITSMCVCVSHMHDCCSHCMSHYQAQPTIISVGVAGSGRADPQCVCLLSLCVADQQ